MSRPVRVLLLPALVASAAIASAIAAPPADGGRRVDETSGHETVPLPETGGENEGAATPEVVAVERAIVERTNAFRKEHDREPVAPNEALNDAARGFARYMAEKGRYGHEADGRTPAERAAAAGYDYCVVRENIAYAFQSTGFTTEQLADRLVTGWKESPGHRRNMLARHVTQTAAAVVKTPASDVYVAVQLFGRPKDAAVAFEVANEAELTAAYRVGGREFELPPRVTRTHTLCVPKEVVFLPAGGAEPSGPPRSVARVEPGGGETLVVVPAGDGYRVDVREPADGGR